MNSNTYSTRPTGWADGQPVGLPDQPPDGLVALVAAVEGLAAQDLNGLSDRVRAARVLGLRGLVDRLEGQWLKELADLDARGAAGADHGEQAASTATWLCNRLRLGSGAARSAVRTARALFRGPPDRDRGRPGCRGSLAGSRSGGGRWHPPAPRPRQAGG